MIGAAEEAVALRGRLPDLRLAADLARLARADGRYRGCDDAAVVAAVGRWTAPIAALEARRLQALRAVVRRNPAHLTPEDTRAVAYQRLGHRLGSVAPAELTAIRRILRAFLDSYAAAC
jgi:hypothetical protein